MLAFAGLGGQESGGRVGQEWTIAMRLTKLDLSYVGDERFDWE